MTILPKWWNDADTAICSSYYQQEDRDDCPVINPDDPEAIQALDDWCDSLHPAWREYTCRRCRHWRSNTGRKGRCVGPEIACGKTAATNTCEQWYPLLRQIDLKTAG